jgi:hypothetical protein
MTKEVFTAFDGQYAGGLWDSIVAGGSWGRSAYSIIRSTELKRVRREKPRREEDLLEIELQVSPEAACPVQVFA